VRCRAEHVFRLKVIGGPNTSSKTAVPIRGAARRRGKKKTLKGKPQKRRLRRDANVEAIARVIYAVGGRATSLRGPESMEPAAGVITNKETSQYWLKHNALPPTAITNHFGNVRGANTFKKVDVLFTVAHHLPPPVENERSTAAILARDPQCREILKGCVMYKETQYIPVRLHDIVLGAPVDTLVHPCNHVNEKTRATVVGQNIQAQGRGRAVRRGPDDPLLEVTINNIVDATTFDAVIEWRDLAGLDERDAVLHAYGVAPVKPADMFKLAPELFTAPAQCQHVLRKLRGPPRPLLPAVTPNLLGAAAYAHPLLTAAVPRLAVVIMKYPSRAPRKARVWLDERRAEEGAANLARKLGMPLLRWQWID